MASISPYFLFCSLTSTKKLSLLGTLLGLGNKVASILAFLASLFSSTSIVPSGLISRVKLIKLSNKVTSISPFFLFFPYINTELITWGTLLGSDNKVASIILSSFDAFRPPLARLRGAAGACVFLRRFSSDCFFFFSFFPFCRKNTEMKVL